MISYLPQPFVMHAILDPGPKWLMWSMWDGRFRPLGLNVLFCSRAVTKKWRFVDQASQEKLQIFSLTFILVNPSTQHELEYCSVSSSHRRTMRTIPKWYFRSLSFLKCCPRLVEKSEDIRIDLQIIRFSWHIRNCWIMWASWKSWLKLFELH